MGMSLVVRDAMRAQILNFAGCHIRTQLWLSEADHQQNNYVYWPNITF